LPRLVSLTVAGAVPGWPREAASPASRFNPPAQAAGSPRSAAIVAHVPASGGRARGQPCLLAFDATAPRPVACATCRGGTTTPGNHMTHLVDIFLQPAKVFEDLRAAELEQAKAMMPGAGAMGWIGAISSAAAIVVVSCLYALYLMLAGKVTGAGVSFKRGMSLVCWSNMPAVLGIVVALVGVATMQPNTALESLMLTNVDPLLVQLPDDSAWRGLARGFSLLNLWCWFLLALGWRIFARAGWLQSAVVALLPSVVIYGAMALFALAK